MIRFLELLPKDPAQPRWLQVRRLIDGLDSAPREEIHCFPVETLALRAGEYGLGLEDPWHLLDIVTYEACEGFYAPGEGGRPFMVTEATVAAGRLKHLERVAKVRAEHEGRTGRRTLGAQRRLDDQHLLVGSQVIRASALDPELADLGRRLLERALGPAREQYRAHQAAVAGGVATLKDELRRRLEQDEQKKVG